MRLQSHRHKTLSIILGSVRVCVCVWWAGGMVSSWVWFELGFSSNCSACCCWFSFGNLCSVCIVCRSVSLCHSERQAFSCLNLSCIMWPIWNKARENKISNRVHTRPEKNFHCNVVVPFIPFLTVSFFFFCKFPIEYFNYFGLLRVLHRCFCLISVFIFSFVFFFYISLSLSILTHTRLFLVIDGHLFCSSFVMELNFTWQFSFTFLTEHNVAYAQLICHVS